jgi:hypothetical protein
VKLPKSTKFLTNITIRIRDGILDAININLQSFFWKKSNKQTQKANQRTWKRLLISTTKESDTKNATPIHRFLLLRKSCKNKAEKIRKTATG